MLVLGAPGTGKTSMLKKIMWRHLAKPASARCPLFVWDPIGNWRSSPGATLLRYPDLEQACAHALRAAPCVLLVDEVDDGIPVNPPPKKGSAVNEILQYGRQARVDGPWRRRGPVCLWGSARRIYDIHPRLRAARVLFLGRNLEERDWRTLASRTGDRSLIQRLPALPDLKFLRYDIA